MTIISFVLVFYLFAASSALTYLSIRSWLHYATHGKVRRMWTEPHWVYAFRSAGFGGIMMAGLIDAVNDNGMRGLYAISLCRIVGYVLLLSSTPRRLRRQPVVSLAFVLLLLGEAIQLLNASGTLPREFYPLHGTYPLIQASALFMAIGVALLWRVYTRTVLRVRLTDKFTLAFSLFSLFVMLVITLSVLAVVQVAMSDTGTDLFSGQQNQLLLALYQNLQRPLLVLFIAVVVASAIVSFFVARSLIAPVNRMGLALRAIGRGELDYRLHGIRSRDEMQDLAVEINEMARRLKEADALRAEFVSFASHELRNPLTAVKGFTDTLAMLDCAEGGGITQEERREIYDIVRSECDRLLRMTNELLDNSRVEAGMPVVLNLQMFDVRKRAEKVAGVMRQHTKKHTLSVIAPEQAVTIEADPDKFEQILINLLSNSIKYAPNGGPIDIRIEDRGKNVEIGVSDKGLGMNSEQAERVFDKFYRIQDTSKRSHPGAIGTGIGLYLTRALVNAHGGTIRVKSEPNEGSTFTVTLPKKAATMDDAPTVVLSNGNAHVHETYAPSLDTAHTQAVSLRSH